MGQAPLLLLAIVLCWFNLPSDVGIEHRQSAQPNDDPKIPKRKLSRVDFLGASVFALLILAFLLPLEIGGVKVPWSHPIIPALFGSAIVLVVLFVIVEKRWAREPIIPLDLFLKKDVVASFAIMGLQSGAQIGVSAQLRTPSS